MHPSRNARVVATLGTALFAFVYCPEGPVGAVGVAPAHAKAFYTRKRVHGKWVTGHFIKKHASAARLAQTRGVRSRLPPVAALTPSSPISETLEGQVALVAPAN